MYNDKEKAILVSKQLEILDDETTTYNFEVEDYHSYYVGENGILVHNRCKYRGGKYKPRAKDIAIDPKRDWFNQQKEYLLILILLKFNNLEKFQGLILFLLN